MTEISDDDDVTTMYVVISDIDRGAYGPFCDFERALEYAEVVDGSVYRCVDAESPAADRSAA
jgi:hypothetical protein